jgi:hypothetical protein
VAENLRTKARLAGHYESHDPLRSVGFLIDVGRDLRTVVLQEDEGNMTSGEVDIASVSPDLLPAFLATWSEDQWQWSVAWWAGALEQTTPVVMSDGVVAEEFDAFLHLIAQQYDRDAQPDRLAPAPSTAMEAIASLWPLHAADLLLTPDDRRVGDAMARLLGELAVTQDPPRGVIQEAARWFADKADLFAEEFAKAAGKASGTTAAVGVGVGVAWATGKAGDLVSAIRDLWEHVR